MEDMTDAQMVTLVVAILAMFAGTMFNNSRIGDVNSRMGDLNGRITDLKSDLHRHIDDKFALLIQQMRTMEDNILRQVGDHETRLQKLEKRQEDKNK